MQLRHLRTIAVLAPIAFLAMVEILRHFFLSEVDFWIAYLALAALMTSAISAFAAWIFKLIERMEQEIYRQNRELAILNRIAALLSRSLDLDTCLAMAVDEALEATGCEAGEVFVNEERTGQIVQLLHRGSDAELFAERTSFRPGEGFPGLAAAQGQTVLVDDLAADRRFLRTKVKVAGFRAFASIPLKVREKVVGTLNVATRRRDLDRNGLRLLEAIAGQIGMRIENARLHAQVVEANDYLTRLIEYSGDAIITTDTNLRVLSWNRGAAEIYGYNAAEVVGKPFHMVPPHLAGQVAEIMAPLQRGETVRNIETQRLHKSGRLIDVVVTASPLLDAAGRIIGFCGISKDVTELKRLEQDVTLHQERERIGRDLHDGLIQSLYAVGLNLEACANRLGPDQEALRSRLNQSVDHLTRTIGEVRDYIFDLCPDEPLGKDAEEGLLELVQAFQIDAQVQTSLEIEPGLLDQLAVEPLAQLKHVIRECLANVSKHAAANSVRVQMRTEPAGLVLRVLDDGRGFIVDSDADTGYGLANMAIRAESLGGTFSVNSAPGQGTQVELCLPLDAMLASIEVGGG